MLSCGCTLKPPPPCPPRKATYGIGVMMIGYVVPVKVQQRGVSPIIAHGPAGNAPRELLGYYGCIIGGSHICPELS